MNKKWKNVKWMTLTEPNGTSVGEAWLDYDHFMWEMTKHYKCHIQWVTGIEMGHNAHCHVIASVPEEEEERFWSKDRSFNGHSKWKFRKADFQKWKDGFGTVWYTTVKHTRLPDKVRCPKKAKPCRKGRCLHIA